MRKKMHAGLLPGVVGIFLGIAGTASAAVYTDALNDNNGGAEVDIDTVEITNDLTNITFKITARAGSDFVTNRFGNYEIGIQKGTGAGGQTVINGMFGQGNPAVGNPYGNQVGISTGMNFFIGSFLAGTGFDGGGELFSFDSVGGWTKIGPTSLATQTANSTQFSFPLSALGLAVGDSFKFDVWTTFGSPQSAYDALSKSTNATSPGFPFPNPTVTPYDAATASGSNFAQQVYTVVPEPASVMALALIGVVLGARRR
jgi:hypothetical protein